MSMSQKAQALEQTPGKVSNYTEAEILPIFYGRHRIATKWFSAPFNWAKRAYDSRKSDFYYASIAGALACGPVDWAGDVWMNGKICYTFPGDRNPEHTLEEMVMAGDAGFSGDDFRFCLYWGDNDQPADAYLQAGTGQDNGPLPGICWVMCKQLDLGAGQTSIPSIEFALGRKTPAVGSWPSTWDANYGVNPIAALYGFLTDPRARANVKINVEQWGRKAHQLFESGVNGRVGNDTLCHPIWKSDQTLGQVVDDLLSYFNGFFRWTENGWEIDFVDGASVDKSTLTQLTEDDCEDLPERKLPVAGDAVASVTVSFVDSDRNYEDAADTQQAPANQILIGDQKGKKIERPFIRKADQAAKIAAREAYDSAFPKREGTQRFFRSRAVNRDGSPLSPGDLFCLNLATNSISQAVRVTETSDEGGEFVELNWAVERTAFPVAYAKPANPVTPPADYSPTEPPASAVKFAMMPAAFGVRQMACLVDRQNIKDAGLNIYYSPTNGGTWAEVQSQGFWAVKGLLNAAITEGASSVTIQCTGLEAGRIQSMNTTEQGDDRLLALIGSELVSIGSVSVPSAGLLTLSILRGRQGTTAAAAASAAPVWVFYRSELNTFTHVDFSDVRTSGAYDLTKATKYFKLQTVAATGTGPIGATTHTFTLPDYDPSAIGMEIRYSTVATSPGDPTSEPAKWSATSSASTVWLAVRYATSAGWGAWQVMKVKGADGAPGSPGNPGKDGNDGATGNYIQTVYCRSLLVPGTPTGAAPAGWSSDPSSLAGSSPIWMSRAAFTSGGVLWSAWSTPVRLFGNIDFVQDTAPTTPTAALIPGDRWIKTLNQVYQLHIWDGSSWNLKDFDAFENIGGVVYMKQAVIRAVSAGSIQAGDITTVNLATTGRIFNPSYQAVKFRSVEPAVLSGSQNFGSGSAWGFTHGTGKILEGPGSTSKGANHFNIGQDGTAQFDFFGQLVGYTGTLTAYYRKNGSGSYIPIGACSSNDGGNARIKGFIQVSGLALTDWLEFFLAPCDPSGNLQPSGSNVTITRELTVLAFNAN